MVVSVAKIGYPDKECFLCMDACLECLRGVLMQEGHLIAYESLKLKEYENNYAFYDLELEVTVHALKMWRHYLIRR